MGIVPGAEVDIAKKGREYVLVVNPIEMIKRKWRGKFKVGPKTMEYMDEVRGKAN